MCSSDRHDGFGFVQLLYRDWRGVQKADIPYQGEPLELIAIGPESDVDMVRVRGREGGGPVIVSARRPAYGRFLGELVVEDVRILPAAGLSLPSINAVTMLELVGYTKVPAVPPTAREPRLGANNTFSVATGGAEAVYLYTPTQGAGAAVVRFSNDAGGTVSIRIKGMSLRSSTPTAHNDAIWPTKDDDTAFFSLAVGKSVTANINVQTYQYDYLQVIAKNATGSPVVIAYNYEVRD